MSTVIGNRSSHRGVARGFTLVELLVVIGIISLLVSILLPTLSRARDSARNIQCANNLRQVGIAFMGYQNDFEGYLPSPKAVGVLGDAAITWEEAIMPYLGLSEEWDPTIPTPIGLDVPHFACPFDTETRGVDDRRASLGVAAARVLERAEASREGSSARREVRGGALDRGGERGSQRLALGPRRLCVRVHALRDRARALDERPGSGCVRVGAAPELAEQRPDVLRYGGDIGLQLHGALRVVAAADRDLGAHARGVECDPAERVREPPLPAPALEDPEEPASGHVAAGGLARP